MKLIPTLKCQDLKTSLDFYVNVLGFQISFMDEQLQYAGITKEDCEIHLALNDGALSIVYVQMDEVDNLFLEFTKRGLNHSSEKESPVHQSPIDQTWGMREFYVDDPSGNTLRFGCPIK